MTAERLCTWKLASCGRAARWVYHGVRGDRALCDFHKNRGEELTRQIPHLVGTFEPIAEQQLSMDQLEDALADAETPSFSRE